jgi:hypothetical protein
MYLLVKKKGGVLPSESYVDNGFQTSKIVKKVRAYLGTMKLLRIDCVAKESSPDHI